MITTGKAQITKCANCSALVCVKIEHNIHGIGLFTCPACKIFTSSYVGKPVNEKISIKEPSNKIIFNK